MPQKVITQTQVMNAVIDQMIADKGLDLAGEELENLRNALRAEMQERIERDMLDALSDEELARLNELIDKEASEEEMDEFFRGLKVNFDEVVKESMVRFRKEYLSGELEGQDAE